MLAWPVIYRLSILIMLAVFAYRRFHDPSPRVDWRILMPIGIGLLGFVFLIEDWEGLTRAEMLKALTFDFPTGKGPHIARKGLRVAYICFGAEAIDLICRVTIPRTR